jgi:sulfite reductase (NADPH) flavoprotein alpha-component
MLSAAKLQLLQDLVSQAKAEEIIWINGYLSGILAQPQTESRPQAAASATNRKLTIAYGTETGNSKKLASHFALQAKNKGFPVKLVALDQYRMNDLQKEDCFLTIVSTQGEGEPPAAAKKFYDHIHRNGFQLSGVKYGVLALGDTSYPLFCKAGEDVDNQLHKLGGERLVPLQKCDTDYEPAAAGWFQQVLEQLGGETRTIAKEPKKQLSTKPTGKKQYNGTIITSINLNDIGSQKETYHLEIAAEGVSYHPGDSIGIVPENSVHIVEAILQELKTDLQKKFTYRNEEYGLADLLKGKLQVNYLPERVVAAYANLVSQEIPATRIGLLDLLRIYPLNDEGQLKQLVAILEPITPRLYSISSSPEMFPDEVHITVSRNRFTQNDQVHFGHCSDYLAQLPVGTEFRFYIHSNEMFRLPAPEKDVIMIGPGTGIAPFRSFLQHRESSGAPGRNWLFFGDQHFVTDFLYQSEIQNWQDTGVLARVNVAFSRDQSEKVYVQHKIQREGEEVFNWIKEGATVYVCGSKEPMSMDVEETLAELAMNHGNKTKEEAVAFLDQLKTEGRYLKDVY